MTVQLESATRQDIFNKTNEYFICGIKQNEYYEENKKDATERISRKIQTNCGNNVNAN
jgi:hypothetical protein